MKLTKEQLDKSLRTNQRDFVVNGRQYQALVDGLNVLINEQ